MIYSEFSERESDIVTGTIQRIENRNYYIDLGKIEAVLGPSEQIQAKAMPCLTVLKLILWKCANQQKGRRLWFPAPIQDC